MSITPRDFENVAFVDGGSRGNPGPAASAFALSIRREHILTQANYLGTATNNEAEYSAIISLLEYIQDTERTHTALSAGLYIFSDSMLVVNQTTHRWRVKDPRMEQYRDRALDFVSTIHIPVRLLYVGRGFNTEADRAVNDCLDLAAKGEISLGDSIAWEFPRSCQPTRWAETHIDRLTTPKESPLDLLVESARPAWVKST